MKNTSLSYLCLLILLIPFSAQLHAQTLDKKFRKIHTKFFRPDKFVGLKFNDVKEDSVTLMEMIDLLSFLNNFQQTEKRLNGKAGIGFVGNQSKRNEFFRVNSSLEIDHGLYPFELDILTRFQSTIKDGKFQDDISEIDVSMDFHHRKIADSLRLENFVFLNRSNNDFLNIKQRYEVGAGFIVNWYSDKLTGKGSTNRDSLRKKPTFSRNDNDDLVKCYADRCSEALDIQQLTKEDLVTISETREWYEVANKKRYSKFRFALLFGIYYELEKVNFDETITVADSDTVISLDFDATSLLRWNFRPTIVWQPNDAFQFKLYPYLKFPIGKKWQTKVVQEDQNLINEREDYYLDINASVKYKITDRFDFSFRYRYIYDHAPRRQYVEFPSNNYSLVVANQYHHNFDIQLKANF